MDIEPDDTDEPQGTPVFDQETGSVRVLSRLCGTCIYRPDFAHVLGPGRRDEMENGAVEEDTYIPCHNTLAYGPYPGTPGAICRGFFNRRKNHSAYTRLAQFFDNVQEVDPPGEAAPTDTTTTKDTP